MLKCLYVSFSFSTLIWQLFMGSEMRVVKSTDFSSNIDLGKNQGLARSLATWPSVNRFNLSYLSFLIHKPEILIVPTSLG